VAILPDGASFEEFVVYVSERRGDVPMTELKELYERRLRLKSVSIATGETMRAMLPKDEQHLTMREREKKVLAEARAAGHTPERA
jgi:hypothetical protein|tara:strand:- start:3099 stop:3353 length:255 start_codon:yes stop_codon:yes gene_type:complete